MDYIKRLFNFISVDIALLSIQRCLFKNFEGFEYAHDLRH